MIVVGVDPGTYQSAIVVWDGQKVLSHGLFANEDALAAFIGGAWRASSSVLVCEWIESFGMPVGREVFQTVFWCGRFAQAWSPHRYEPLPRREVKQHLCHSARATDSNIRQAILDRFGGDKAIGLKKTPGPLYGMKGHEFAAFAVALTFWDRHGTDGEQIRPGTTAEW